MSFEAPSVFCITSQAERDWISARSDVRFDDRDGEPFLPVDDSYILTPSRASDDSLRVEMLTHPDVDKWLMMVPKPYSEVSLYSWLAGLTTDESKSWHALLMNETAATFSDWRRTGVCPGCPFTTIRQRSDRSFAGECRLVRKTTFHERTDDETRHVELVRENEEKAPGDPSIVWTLGFVVHPSHAGRGLMTSVLRTVLDRFAIPTMDVRTIVSHAFLGNEPSRRVHLKLGFEEKGTTSVVMPPWRGGKPRDEWFFVWERRQQHESKGIASAETSD